MNANRQITAKAVFRQMNIALFRPSNYPTSHIPVNFWAWRWDKHGKVQYQQWRTLWQYLAA